MAALLSKVGALCIAVDEFDSVIGNPVCERHRKLLAIAVATVHLPTHPFDLLVLKEAVLDCVCG